MSYRRLHAWQVVCDVCNSNRGDAILSERQPTGLPVGWTTRTLDNCGMTGYTRHEVVCPSCTAKIASYAREAETLKPSITDGAYAERYRKGT